MTMRVAVFWDIYVSLTTTIIPDGGGGGGGGAIPKYLFVIPK